MSFPAAEFGLLFNAYPYARIGGPGPPLVFFPGINDALQELRSRRRFIAWFCARFAPGRTVYWIGRRRGMPLGHSIRNMADDYAEVLCRGIGRTDVLGLSMGGLIAQEFAAAHPQLLNRLVLALCGCRTPPGFAEVYRHWERLALEGRWREVYLELVARTYGPVRRRFYESLLPAEGKLFLKVTEDSNDFVASVRACVDFDTRPRLPRIVSPTLVVGAELDQVMPAEIARELADQIPGAELYMIQAAGHGAFEEQAEQFDRVILEFLNRRDATMS